MPSLSLAELHELPRIAGHLALSGLHLGGDAVHEALRVVDGEIRQLDGEGEFVLFVVARRGLHVGDVGKAHLTLLHGAFVEDFRRDGLGCDVDALLLRLLQHGGEEAHLELKGQDVHAGGTALPALGDDLLHKQAAHGQVDRADDNETAAVLAVEKGAVRQRLGAVGFQNEIAELLFLAGEGLLLLFAGERARRR
jgi:hypothetical protein